VKFHLRGLFQADGFSIVELMVAAVLLSLVVASGLRFFTIQHRAVVRQEDVAEVQQQLRSAMDMMTGEFMRIGSGVPPEAPGILGADPARIDFDGNLAGASARLSAGASAGDRRLYVYYLNRSGSFRSGKSVSLCRVGACERHRLAEDGNGRSILLEAGLEGGFPSGSLLAVINRVSYEIKPAVGAGGFRLVRTVDGGANSVAEGIGSMSLEYLDRNGAVTEEPGKIRRIGVLLSAPLPRHPEIKRTIRSEVQLRN
jgi:type II secretory pathway pseudopilin PulG